MQYAAARGVANRVTVTFEDDGMRITDTSLTAGKGCTAIDTQTVRCPRGYLTAELGDGDDRFAGDAGGTVDGGPGNDVITGAGSATGGPGSDELQAAAMIDGDGAQPAPDRYLGGPGTNTLSYQGRKQDLRVDLRRQGEPQPDGDVFTGIENLEGGDGDDVLIGDGGDNWISGGKGSDVIRGLEGRDLVSGGPAADRADSDSLYGGSGDDSVLGGQRTECGLGEDRAFPADDVDSFPGTKRRYTPPFVRTDCEVLFLSNLSAAFRLHARPLFITADGCTCLSAVYTATSRGKQVARTHVKRGNRVRVRLKAGTKGRITVRIFEHNDYSDARGAFRTSM